MIRVHVGVENPFLSRPLWAVMQSAASVEVRPDSGSKSSTESMMAHSPLSGSETTQEKVNAGS